MAIYSGPNRVSFPLFPFHLKKQVGLTSEMWDVWLKTLNYIQNIIHNYGNISGVPQHGLHTSFLKLAQVLCRKAVSVTCMYCCVYNARLLMMDRETVRNMQELYSKNKFEKLVHLVGFIVRIYHDARSSECQMRANLLVSTFYYSQNIFNHYSTMVTLCTAVRNIKFNACSLHSAFIRFFTILQNLLFPCTALTFWHQNFTFKFQHTLYVKCE